MVDGCLRNQLKTCDATVKEFFNFVDFRGGASLKKPKNLKKNYFYPKNQKSGVRLGPLGVYTIHPNPFPTQKSDFKTGRLSGRHEVMAKKQKKSKICIF